VRNYAQAVARRDWVIGRMVEDRSITPLEAELAWNEPLEIRQRGETEVAEAAHFAEEVRRELVRLYGDYGLYEGGLSVRTTLDPRLQMAAERALRDGLIAYDRRHGWRGPLARLGGGDLGREPSLGRDPRRRAGLGACLGPLHL
jgi:penicillin-binding protein 1A